jgi:tRNA modification GTPase
VSASTIFALSSGSGRAGIGVIRVSGPRASSCLQVLCGSLPVPRRASVRVIKDPSDDEAIDRALVLWMPAPATVTGEDMIELHVHGGAAVVKGVLAALGGIAGVRLANAGEFTRRAFENGKLDLTQVEGLADLIDAETAEQRRQALRQADGHLFRLYDGWRGSVLRASGLVEAAIDFSDESDVVADATAQAEGIAGSVAVALGHHLTDKRRGEIIRDGFQVVLVGAPNSGKSSLINCLARRDVAIVSAEAGTTRDVLDVRLDLDGLAVVVSDTAGLREAEGLVEREGIRRALARARGADLVVWLVDATSEAVPLVEAAIGETVARLVVLSKADLVPDAGRTSGLVCGALPVSSNTGEGIDALIEAIVLAARKSIGGGEVIALTQARHRSALEDCRSALIMFGANRDSPIEIRAEALRQAATALGRVTGRIDVEDVLGEIFGRFCIGK